MPIARKRQAAGRKPPMALPDTVTVEAYEYSMGVHAQGVHAQGDLAQDARGTFTKLEAPVVAEYPVTLLINGSPFVSISCSGTDLELLALGHLMAEGIIRSPEEIESIKVDEENLSIDIETGQGALGFYLVSDGSIAPYRFRIRPPSLINLSVLRELCIGWKIGDMVVILGSIDINLAEVDR